MDFPVDIVPGQKSIASINVIAAFVVHLLLTRWGIVVIDSHENIV